MTPRAAASLRTLWTLWTLLTLWTLWTLWTLLTFWTLLTLWTLWTLLTLSTLLIIPNMAHPNMEDAQVAPLNRPDGGFPAENIIMIVAKSTGVARFGPKIDENQHLG